MSLKSSNKVDTNLYQLEVEVSAEQLKDAKVKAYHQQKKNISIPGFRKGKVPMHMIEKMYGAAFFYEDAIDIIYPDVVGDAVKEAELEIVAAPHDVEITKIDETGAEISLKVYVKPEEIELGEYKGLKAEKMSAEVTDEEVDTEINSMRDRNARIITVEDRAVESGDISVIDFEGFVDGEAFDGGKGEDFELTIGSGQFIPGFEDQIIGKNIGEEFDVNVTFPEEYAPELAGKDAVFKVTVKSLKAKELPELDDELAKDVSEFDTLDELKADIKAKAFERKETQSKEKFESDLLKQVAEGMKVEIPDVMIDNKANELKQQMQQQMQQQGLSLDIYLQYMGIEAEKFNEDMKERATAQIKTRLALEKVAEIEEIEVSEEELNAEYEKMAENYKIDVEEIKKFVDEEGMKNDLKISKASDFIIENAIDEKPEKASSKKKFESKDDDKVEKKSAPKKVVAKKKAEPKSAAKAEKDKDTE